MIRRRFNGKDNTVLKEAGRQASACGGWQLRAEIDDRA
jgi:hypothetical protein